MNNKQKIIFVGVILVMAVIGVLLYHFTSTNQENNQAKNIEEILEKAKEKSDIDWSNYQEKTIELTSSYTITSEGIYHFTGTLENGNIEVNTNGEVKIILDNVSITNSNGPAIHIISAGNTYIELTGENKIESLTTEELDGAIYSKDDLFILGDGSLSVTSNQDGIVSKDDLTILDGIISITSNDDGIRGKDSVTIQNGQITINAKGDGIKTSNEEEKGDIIITDGTIKITSELDGIQAESTLTIGGGNIEITAGSTTNSSDSRKGLKADDGIYITGGDFKITSADDSIHSNKDILIKGGIYTLSSGDDGIHADNNFIIDGGTINITRSYEGIEASNITINDGTIKITTSDDGVNISGGKDSSNQNDMFAITDGILTINGGTLQVNAKGDGLDSNGSIKMTGGNVYVDGPEDNGNGALDYNGSFEITGGTLIAVGSSGMVQNVSNNSSQNTVLINLGSTYTGTIELGSITYEPSKKYSSILISSSLLEKNTSYELKIGGTTLQNITLSNTVTTIGNNGMQGGMMNHQRQQNRRMQ
ncbi:MAG: carbohydrate-binding domain-containing protein [Bacilli bacterium]|nr:carbohydrate-binding domain-containing protein [Bacilli bacterium]